ncbi:AMP-binding protein [Ramlibacter sp. 2FC]|uniref:AMP-binding protein n=1 Tax=Ramlibacter sp. 2FC TaxID=2502188 RepID=UPI0010F8DC0D|nr:AMP-binding protein [Ramlibacter sp. 2FC]
MLIPEETSTLGEAFFQAVALWPDQALISAPANDARNYLPQGQDYSYRDTGAQVRRLMQQYADAGWGCAHRIGLLLENRPEHFFHKLAMNALGACCVPINADYRARELAYLIDHAALDLVVVLSDRVAQLQEALALAARRPHVVVLEDFARAVPAALRPAAPDQVSAQTPASILYTSGTTGRPKGCVLSHRYELAAGHWYATRGGLASLRDAQERLYNPLPLFHVSASVLSFYAMMLTGNCQVQTDRFQPSRWWTEIRSSGATIVHYLGVVVQLLMAQPPTQQDREHAVRFGLGAGVEPQLHAMFEQRFGFPLLEIWGMTEMVRALVDNMAPRQVGTRTFGRAVPGVEVRVVDDQGRDLADGEAGEMLVRHSAQTPRKDFFSGYLDDEVATEAAWEGGWFHTGDIVTRHADGMLRFVERRKNIIRRSGENIAPAEIEALLQTHPLVRQVAVLAVKDELREEEVLACVALNGPAPADPASRLATAQALFDFCNSQLAYHKVPGWFWITDAIPATATQKIQKHSIFAPGTDPRELPGMVDLRARKKRATRS